jgi:hypothetical protein
MRFSIRLVALICVITPGARADPDFTAKVRAAAAGYQQWGRVDEHPNIALADCAAPAPDDYGVASRVMRSTAPSGPHRDKLYYLWASDRGGYRRLARSEDPLPMGFTIVKESFAARGLNHAPSPPAGSVRTGATPAPISWLEVGGQIVATGERRDLFVIAKVGGRGVAGTDDGWIYGTVAPDGTVTSSGRVDSCMHCHAHATHERMFGPKRDR